jgi:beta-galactosidase
MPESFDNIEYYGMGPEENLSDYYAQSIIGIYETTVEEMYEPYIRPQEHGNRCRVRYVKVTDNDGVGLEFAYKDNYFSFNARKFTQKLLDNANHIEDLHSEHTTAVNIDGFTRGAGTQSCGPDVLDKYLIDGSKDLEFSFSIIPIENK